MNGNPSFPSPVPPLAEIESAIDDLAEAETVARTRVAGAVAARQVRRRHLESLLEQLRVHVQAQADATPEHGASIIESAGIRVKKARVASGRGFTVKRGRVAEEVILSAPKAGNRAGYEWAYSLDGGKTWVTLPVTVQAATTVRGLIPGTKALFRYRSVTRTGATDWSDPFPFIVH